MKTFCVRTSLTRTNKQTAGQVFASCHSLLQFSSLVAFEAETAASFTSVEYIMTQVGSFLLCITITTWNYELVCKNSTWWFTVYIWTEQKEESFFTYKWSFRISRGSHIHPFIHLSVLSSVHPSIFWTHWIPAAVTGCWSQPRQLSISSK